jgi:Domain of Unknown Function with PDB structure (DUF3857)
MNLHPPFARRVPFVRLLLLTVLFLSSMTAHAQQWKPIDPSHLALKAPTVEKDADAEAIFWEVYLKDEWDGDYPRKVLSHYIRIKIFNERGIEKHGKIDIPYFSQINIRDIAARTIKPDGTIVELKKDSIFDREIVRLSGLKFKSKSFAMPAVEPGSIIEYRWNEQRPFNFYTRLHFQREIPVQSVKYYIKPLSNIEMGMRSITFHAQATAFTKEKDGYVSTGQTNVPAFLEEPRMPPEDQVRSWMLLYYSKSDKIEPDKFWKEYGKSVYESNKGLLKVNDEVRKAATAALGDASTAEQKLERILTFCRTQIKNVNDDTTTLSDEERKKLKENRSPADTLKRGYGHGKDIDLLFAALAMAAGFEARIINLPDRNDIFFDPNVADDYFLNVYDIAVKVGEEWKFFDPSSRYVSLGMLRWQQEGQPALIADPKEPTFVKTPLSPAEKSLQKRTAKMRLLEDGTLEGEARIEYTGHFAADRKEYHDEESASEREEQVRQTVQSRLGNIEVTDIKLEDVTDPFKPLVYSYKVRVPGFAERTGKRLFLQPAFFQKGIGPLFPTSNRRHDIYFHFPWMEDDDVTIELPEGFALDNAESPASFNFGEVGKYEVNLGITKDKKALVYKRKLKFSGLIFPKSSYENLKKVFDSMHQQDNHAVTLKQDVSAAVKQ